VIIIFKQSNAGKTGMHVDNFFHVIFACTRPPDYNPFNCIFTPIQFLCQQNVLLVLYRSYPDIQKVSPIIFDAGSRNYYGIGQLLGEGWNVGKKFLQQE
jgi:hypothetical protein